MTIDMRYDPTRGHWCDFCQTFHSSQSCYHPGGNMLREAQNRIAELTLGIKSLTERCGDLEGDLERMLAQKIGEQKAKAKAEREVERLRKENRDLMLDWQRRQDKYEEELAKYKVADAGYETGQVPQVYGGYHNPIANKPGDEAEQNPIPEHLQTQAEKDDERITELECDCECAHRDAVAWYGLAEKYRWMLYEAYVDWVDGESYESWLADLASRWEER